MKLEEMKETELAQLAREQYFYQIESGERDVVEVLNSFMIDGFKGFRHMTKDELIEWIKISS